MKVEEIKQTEDIETQELVINDLPLNDEQASQTNGGETINYTPIKFVYKSHRSDGTLE